MEINSREYIKLNSYLNLFENADIRMPVSVNFKEEELFVLLSLFCKSEVVGLSLSDELKERIEDLVPNECTKMIEKGWLFKKAEKLTMFPQIALLILCMSSAEKTIVFTSDSLQAGQEQLSVYVYRNELFLSIFKTGSRFEVRLDSNLQKMCHYLFNSYLQEEESSFHSEEFIGGLSEAFEYLEDEKEAVWNEEYIKREFTFKVFDKKNTQSSSKIYSFIQFEDIGAGIYEMNLAKFERCNRMYAGKSFYFEKKDCVGLFANALEVICNG